MKLLKSAKVISGLYIEKLIVYQKPVHTNTPSLSLSLIYTYPDSIFYFSVCIYVGERKNREYEAGFKGDPSLSRSRQVWILHCHRTSSKTRIQHCPVTSLPSSIFLLYALFLIISIYLQFSVQGTIFF